MRDGAPTSCDVYPGMVLVEGTNLSEGRGTTRPFELFGAPWLEPQALAAEIGDGLGPGLQLRPSKRLRSLWNTIWA